MADVNGLKSHANLFRRGGGLIPPSDVVASWPAANHVNPETHSDVGPVMIIVMLCLSMIVYMARMWARVILSKNAGLDDWIMTAAIIPLIGATVAVVLACRTYGFQWHAWDQTPETLITTRQFILAIEVLYLASTSLIKISILCFYKRMTNGSISKTFLYWIWGSIVFVIAYFFVFTFTIIFSCSPIEGYWHYFDINWRLTHELKCHNEGAQIVAVVVVSTIQDFILCALPVLLIWNLQIPRRQKAALCGIFGVGLLTCICGVMRAYYATYVYYYTYDITWYAWYGWIWTTLEAQLGLMCACGPALKGFAKRYFTMSTIRSDAYGYSSKQHSNARRIPGYGKLSAGNSLATSSEEITKWDHAPVPMGAIKVSTVTMVDEDKEETASQNSVSSTKNLKALPSYPLPAVHRDARGSDPFSVWNGNRTVVTAYHQDQDIDVEKDARSASRS